MLGKYLLHLFLFLFFPLVRFLGQCPGQIIVKRGKMIQAVTIVEDRIAVQ